MLESGFVQIQRKAIFLALSFYASASKGAASTILMPVVWQGRDSNPRPTAPEAGALPLELLGPIDR